MCNNVLVSIAALSDDLKNPKYTKRAQILMVEEVAKAVQLPLISKELYETTNGEAQGTASMQVKIIQF